MWVLKLKAFSRFFRGLLNFSVDLECFIMSSKFKKDSNREIALLILLQCAKMNLIVKPI